LEDEKGDGILESLSRESEEVDGINMVEIFVEEEDVEEEEFEDDEIFDCDADFVEKVLNLDLLIFFGSYFVLTIESLITG
jgi:hypothetical protein